MTSSSKILLVAAGLAVAVLGCVKKSTGGGGTDAGQISTGGSGAGGNAVAGGGSGGSSSVAGSGGSGGSGGRAAAAPVTCGTKTCMASSAFLTACCMDPATGTCGVKNGMACDLPGVADPRCPDRPAAMGLTAKGCCTVDNKCGGTLRGLPCIVPNTDGGKPLACDAAGADAGN